MYFVKCTKQFKERHKSNDEYAIIAIGRVGRDFFVKRGMNVVLDIIGLPDQPSFADIKEIATIKLLVCSLMEHMMNFICIIITYVSAIQT